VRTRLLVIVLVLVGLVALGLGGLLAWTTAQFAQQGFFTRRLTDTVYLASLVQRPVTDADATDLDALLARYSRSTGWRCTSSRPTGRRSRPRRVPRRSTGREPSGSRPRWPGAGRSRRRCNRHGTTPRS
jgi:hypothetical protein